MHHWLWDKAKGDTTTHEGMMESMRLASAPQDLRHDLVSSFSEPPASFTYEPADEYRPKIRRALEKNAIRPVDSADLRPGTRRFEEATGVSVVYFTGGPETLGGFTSRDTPDVIYISAETSNVPTAWLLAHELTHVAQKDKSVDTDGLFQEIKSLLSAKEHAAILSKLAKNYDPAEWDHEILAHLMEEAFVGENIFGLQDLANSKKITESLTDAFDAFPVMKPEVLKSGPDSELARLASAPRISPDLIEVALAPLTPMHRQVFQASQATSPMQRGVDYAIKKRILDGNDERTEGVQAAARAFQRAVGQDDDLRREVGGSPPRNDSARMARELRGWRVGAAILSELSGKRLLTYTPQGKIAPRGLVVPRFARSVFVNSKSESIPAILKDGASILRRKETNTLFSVPQIAPASSMPRSPRCTIRCFRRRRHPAPCSVELTTPSQSVFSTAVMSAPKPTKQQPEPSSVKPEKTVTSAASLATQPLNLSFYKVHVSDSSNGLVPPSSPNYQGKGS